MNEPNLAPKKFKPAYFIAATLAVVVIMVGTYQIGYSMGREGNLSAVDDIKFFKGNEPAAPDYNMLWQALEIMDQKFIEKPIDQKKTLYGAIQGAISAAGDQYTTFFEPKALDNFKSELKGNFEGIGAQVDKKGDYIVIVAPIDDSPAQRAGLRAQDLILEVNGTSTQGMSLEEAVSKIRGEKGTKVNLKISREGKKEPFDVEIIRDVILVKSVKVKYEDIEKDGVKKKIAVITLTRFGDDTNTLFDAAVKDITRNQRIDGIVVDLRNNPGGYLESAVELASYWLPDGKLVVSEVFSDRPKTDLQAKGNNLLGNYKTVIITNGGSASASEILSGALRDHGLAKIVGEKTFGKGSVQELIPLGETGAAVKVTVAKWVTPSGVNLNKDGLKPDVEVKPTEEDIEKQNDVQLKAAYDELFK